MEIIMKLQGVCMPYMYEYDILAGDGIEPETDVQVHSKGVPDCLRNIYGIGDKPKGGATFAIRATIDEDKNVLSCKHLWDGRIAHCKANGFQTGSSEQDAFIQAAIDGYSDDIIRKPRLDKVCATRIARAFVEKFQIVMPRATQWDIQHCLKERKVLLEEAEVMALGF